MSKVLYTIGHSNHPAPKVIELLKLHGITALVDVRSQPYSRMNPQFNREAFRESLRLAGIAYIFLGRELGARSEDPECYVNDRVQYDRLAKSTGFQNGLERVVNGTGTHTVALMCAEKDPLTCHRTILVCRHLVAREIAVAHILEDGRLETHDAAIARLLAELGLNERDLFKCRAEIIDEAYAKRAGQIAYVVPAVDRHNEGREASG